MQTMWNRTSQTAWFSSSAGANASLGAEPVRVAMGAEPGDRKAMAYAFAVIDSATVQAVDRERSARLGAILGNTDREWRPHPSGRPAPWRLEGTTRISCPDPASGRADLPDNTISAPPKLRSSCAHGINPRGRLLDLVVSVASRQFPLQVKAQGIWTRLTAPCALKTFAHFNGACLPPQSGP